MPVKAFRISVGLALFALAVACSKKVRDEEVPFVNGTVDIKLKCENNGNFSATVNPWRVTMSQVDGKKAIRWKLNSQSSGATYAVIDSVSGQPWPFKTKRFRVDVGGAIDGDSTDTNPGKETLYHYKISTACTFDGVTDTIVIDPDMILPPRTK